jgi:hypothetical protein
VNSCAHEAEIVAALRAGEWPERLSAHAAGCADCTETLTVARFMGRAAAHFGGGERPLEPTLIWLKAAFLRRHEAERRRTRRRAWAQALAGLGIALAGAAAFESIGPVLSRYSDAFLTAGAAFALALVIAYFTGIRRIRNAGP